MSINYVRPDRQQPQPATVDLVASSAPSKARTELRYWVGQYHQLTARIQAAQVTNADQWRKERVNVRELYSLRAAAAACMAAFAADVLNEP